MGLREYQRKRDFRKTAEPRGARAPSRGAPRFVVQKHDASRLHYDFRLEHDGTLKSWAVPKGPSLDPKEKRLAVEVEDHPLDYGGFEGTIPQDQYGGGTVLLWDRGTWHPEEDPAAGLRRGRLKFRLQGEKLRGGWMLVRLADKPGKPAGKPNWLLIKEKDDEARAAAVEDILAARPESVKSGRDLPAIAAGERPRRRAARVPTRSAPGAKSAPAANSRRAAKKTAPAPRARVPRTRAVHARAARRPARKSLPVPDVPPPQLATLVSDVPAGKDWLHEIKLDGYRILARVADRKASLWTRGGKDWAGHFPSIARAVEALPVSTAVLDGEVVALLPEGRSSFQALQQALSDDGSAELAYFVFDLLHLDGVDWSGRPLLERKAALRKLVPARRTAGNAGQLLRYNDHVRGDGVQFFGQACALGLEGIIAKRAGTPYRPGRSSDWLKIKCSQRQEFVIGGFTEPAGSRTGLGALLLGVYQGDQLRYAGRVGTGFGTATLRELRARLDPLERPAAPFSNPPRGAQARGVHWVRPDLVGEVSFTEWTDDGLLRHPTFEGLRADKPARTVRREQPAAPATAAAVPARKSPGSKSGAPGGKQPPPGRKSAGKPEPSGETALAGVRLSNPDRVLWPEQALTKLDLATYYQSIAGWILPHVAHRPLTLVRCPQGSGKHCFFQKHIKEGGPGLFPVAILEDSGATVQYIQLRDLTGLVALVQMGTLEIHGWGARVEDVERPDRLVFDLDPDPEVPWPRVVAAARLCRARLEELELRSFVQTTGGKGLHVVVPLSRRQSWDEAKPFARAFAAAIEREAPEQFLTKASKAARKGKIFLDWLRNGRGATAILAYSSRARPGAPVATPVGWNELAGIQPAAFTVTTVPGRLAKLRQDPWADFWTVRQSLRQDIRKKLGAL